MMTCNVISPQLFWIKKVRTSIALSWILSIVVNIGMWFERFVIIVTSLHRDYLPSSWVMFYPSWVDVGVFIGSIGVFFTLFLLFQAKKKLIAEKAVDSGEAEYYLESLEKYDSISPKVAEFQKV
jgi:molybdopterin-containing oxidoreductase family membrane subunit